MTFEPPRQDDDTNPSQPIDLSSEPPIAPDDTNPSASQSMPVVDLSQEPPVTPDDTNPSVAVRTGELAALRADEPPIAPDDTNPSIAVRTGTLEPVRATVPLWRRLVGVVSLIGAAALTIGAGWIALSPTSVPPPTAPEDVMVIASEPTTPPTETAEPTVVVPTDPAAAAAAEAADTVRALPTLSPEQAANILAQPLAISQDTGIQVVRNPYDPFTLIPDRPRGEVIQYVVEEGDTIGTIAEKFGLTQESIAWANDRNIIGILPVGRAINIPPVDGVLVPRHTGNTTIREYAARYRVDDPFVIIDSEYNDQLNGLTPDSIPPSGAQVMIPGGRAEQINWNPTVVR
ncbi:MAG: LysM peptidoglycan-binding domain-containing protein, partial [Chloroflexota bacterium]